MMLMLARMGERPRISLTLMRGKAAYACSKSNQIGTFTGALRRATLQHAAAHVQDE
jgi:hypothetical protein